MGNSLAPRTTKRAKVQGETRRLVAKMMSQNDKTKTGSLNREEVRTMAQEFLTKYTPHVGGLTDADVTLIMRLGGSTVAEEISYAELPNAIGVMTAIAAANKDLIELFQKYDKDSSGALPAHQLSALLAEVNEGKAPREEDVDFILKQCEPRGVADPIQLDNLKAALACWYCLAEMPSHEKIKELFQAWDTHNTGTIEKEELKVVLTKLKMPEAEVNAVFAMIDTNHNGKIEYTEFVDWVMSGKAKEDGVITTQTGQTSA